MPAVPDPIHPATGVAYCGQALDCGNDRELVIAIDTLVDGVHFPAGTPPADLGYKALAVNLSDLAAMGAEPRIAHTSLTHPGDGDADARSWLSAFEQGLDALAQRFSVTMSPTVTTRGPLSVTVEALGTLPRGMALRRVGAAPGDRILVTGTLGDAGLALTSGQADSKAGSTAIAPDIEAWLQGRLGRPEPRIEAGIALRGLATAAIDVSDGLASDLGHILSASRVGARLTVDDLPLSPALLSLLPRERAWELALSSGDDYELCFTVSAQREPALRRVAETWDCGIHCLGRTQADPHIEWHRNGTEYAVPETSFRHFPESVK
jgi:thiamine-monophosphate kinase